MDTTYRPHTSPTNISSIHLDSMPVWKRAIDLVACFMALPVLAVAALFMTILTRLVSPGPIFFTQERVGYRGGRFRIYKFRTMRVAADTNVHQSYYKELIGTNAPMMKLDCKGDSRLIPGAWFLRASGLDELPQIINVLRGEMSLIGPRPCIPTEWSEYLPWQRARFNAVPGLTGLWQVSGKNRTTFEQMIQLDIEYSKTRSLWLDLKIISLTIPALLLQLSDTRKARRNTPNAPKSPATVPSLQRAPLHAR